MNRFNTDTSTTFLEAAEGKKTSVNNGANKLVHGNLPLLIRSTSQTGSNNSNSSTSTSSYTSSVAMLSLTRIGSMLFQNEEYQKAQHQFMKALHQVQDRKGNSSSFCLPSANNTKQCLKRKRTSSITDTTVEEEVSYSNKDKTENSCSKDCDEGIHAIHEVVIFDEEATLNEISTTLLYNIAQTYLSLNKYQDATSFFRNALSSSHTSTGMSGSHTSHSVLQYKILHNLGYCKYKMEDCETAIGYYRDACNKLSILGLTEDIMATNTYNSIGVLLFNLPQPDIESSVNILHKCLKIYYTNPTCFTSKQLATLLNNFGRVYFLKGELQKAIQFYQQSLQLRRQELGNDSIDVAATIYNLGNTFHKLKDWTQAMSCFNAFLTIAETSLGLQTREVVFVYKCKAEISQEMKEPEKALQYYDKALHLTKTALSENPREIGCILNKAGNLCFEQGRYQEALKYYVWGLDVENSHEDRDESLILVTLTNIAQTHKHLGRMEMALSFYREVYNIQVKKSGTSKVDIAATLSSIGLMLYHLRHYESALDTYQEALQVRRDHYGSDDNEEIASTLNAIGLVLFKQGLYDHSMQCFQECLDIRKKLLGPDHGDIAMVWYNMASVSYETGDDETALERYEEALRVERASLGDQHPDIILTMVHLGQVKQQCGLLDEALATFQEALRIHHMQPVEDCMREARIYNFLGNCLLQKGDIPRMMIAFAAASRILMSIRCVGEPLAIKGYNLYGLSKLHPECAAAA